MIWIYRYLCILDQIDIEKCNNYKYNFESKNFCHNKVTQVYYATIPRRGGE